MWKRGGQNNRGTVCAWENDGRQKSILIWSYNSRKKPLTLPGWLRNKANKYVSSCFSLRMDFSTYTHAKQKRRREVAEQCAHMERKTEEASVWGSHLGQEVRRLSCYAFQNERGFSVQIGVLEVRKKERESRGEQTKYRKKSVAGGWFLEVY